MTAYTVRIEINRMLSSFCSPNVPDRHLEGKPGVSADPCLSAVLYPRAKFIARKGDNSGASRPAGSAGSFQLESWRAIPLFCCA